MAAVLSVSKIPSKTASLRSAGQDHPFEQHRHDPPFDADALCDANGIGLGVWAKAGFAFLPQAYVNDFGAAVDPTTCVRDAAAFFPLARIHPTVACYEGRQGYVTPEQFAQLLAQAGTEGFSVFPAETLSNPDDWKTYAQAITSLHIAAPLPAG